MKLYIRLLDEEAFDAALEDPPDQDEPEGEEGPVEGSSAEVMAVWLEETVADHLMRSVRNAVLMGCPYPGMLLADPPELDFDSQSDGVLLVTCEAIGLEVSLAVSAKEEANGDLTVVIQDGPGLEIELTVLDTGYSQIG